MVPGAGLKQLLYAQCQEIVSAGRPGAPGDGRQWRNVGQAALAEDEADAVLPAGAFAATPAQIF